MIPFILAAVGGYLIGDSMKDSQTFADGGMMADGGEIKTGDIVQVMQPNHNATGHRFVFEKWLNDEKTAFRGKEYDYGREMRRIKQISPETLHKLTPSEITKKAKSEYQHRKLLESLKLDPRMIYARGI